MLSRKISDEVRLNPELYTLIYLPHPVVVPGGRFRYKQYTSGIIVLYIGSFKVNVIVALLFCLLYSLREIYYWDSFWIIRGLLLCGMFDTVRGMLLNFVHLVKEHGMIPNGGRTYYLNRSQPPLFIQMVDEYVKATNDFSFVM